jgi:hypothetical protein
MLASGIPVDHVEIASTQSERASMLTLATVAMALRRRSKRGKSSVAILMIAAVRLVDLVCARISLATIHASVRQATISDFRTMKRHAFLFDAQKQFQR